LRLSRETGVPLFEQLYEFIKAEIISGHFSSNERLPSKRKLAADLQCSRNTVEAAYNQLVDEGYLISRAKSGYYVAELDGVLSIDRARQAEPGEKGRAPAHAVDFSYQGVDFDHFPFSTWRKLTKDVIDEYDRDLLRTGDPQGYPKLRASIARYLHHSRGVNCLPEQIVISSGTELLLQLLIQLLDRHSVYAIENPGYERLPMIFRSNRVEYRAVSLDEDGVRVDEVERSGANVLCVTPSHQFPTGLIMPVSRRLQLLNWANDRPGRYIIEDDYDSEFRYSGKPIPSLQGLDQHGRVIYMGAFSKSLSPALRISYMVLPMELLEGYRERLSFCICPVPTIEQKTLQRFMDEGHFERHLNRMRNLYRQKRETIVSAIRELLPGAMIDGTTAGLHLVLRVGNGMSETELVERAAARGAKVYGMSRYRSGPVADEAEGTLILGFATLRIDEIYDAVRLLSTAWAA
jgi:GntR family transcriptional regulator/MocR family aminotransferase